MPDLREAAKKSQIRNLALQRCRNKEGCGKLEKCRYFRLYLEIAGWNINLKKWCRSF